VITPGWRRRRCCQRPRLAAVVVHASGGAFRNGAATTTTATTTTTTSTSFSRARTLSRQQPLHPSLLRPLSAEQRRWLAALGISDATVERHGVAAQMVAHPLLGGGGGNDGDDALVDAVAVPYYQSGRLVDARYYVLAPAGGGGAAESEGEAAAAVAEAAAGLVVAASWMARGGRALYVAGEGALGKADALRQATGDVVVVGDELDALAVAEAFEAGEDEEQHEGEERAAEGEGRPLCRPTILAIPQPLPSWRRDVPLYSDPRRRLYHLSQQLQRAREEDQRRRDREGVAPPPTGGGRGSGGDDSGNSSNSGSSGGGLLDYLLPHASSVVFACRSSPKGSHAIALNCQRQQWEQQQRHDDDDEEEEDDERASARHNPSPDAALDGADADEALAAEAARLFGEARCKTVQWPQAWTDHWERWADQSGAGGSPSPSSSSSEADTGLRCGALHMLLSDGPHALRAYVSNPREWPIAGLQRFFDYADEIYTAFGDFDDDEEGNALNGALGNAKRPPLAYSTGWPGLDPFYRVAPGELTLVTGVPNSGKSEWLDALAVNLAEMHGWRFALCSMEKRAADHARQLLEKRARRPMLKGAAYATARGGVVPRMSEEELVAAFRWLDHHFVVLEGGGGAGGGDDDDGGGGFGAAPTLDWILDRARAAVAKYGVRGLIIDPYNEIDHASARLRDGGSRGGGGTLLLEHEHVASVMSSLRRFAQRHSVHVWLVAHPRQMPAWSGQAPTLMDVSGGANFMAKADNGVIVHRDWARVARELAGRPDAAGVGMGGVGGAGMGGGGGGGGKRKKKEEGQEEAGGAAAAAQAQADEAAAAAAASAKRADFGVRIILAKVRNKTSGQRGEAALEYDPVTGRYSEPSWGGGAEAEAGDDDSAPKPPAWAADPAFAASAAAAAAPHPNIILPPAHTSDGTALAGQQEQLDAAPSSPSSTSPALIPLSGGAFAEVSAQDWRQRAAAYDALLEAQLDEWEQHAAEGQGENQEEEWLVNTRRARGLDEPEIVDFDDWRFEKP
jgi:hypothetical protein